MHAYSSPLQINSVAKDLDVELAQQEAGITLNWECKNLAKNEACKKIDKTPLSFNSTLQQNYGKKIFEPYNSYQFNITGSKGDKIESGIAIIVIVETNLPQLSVAVPELALNQKVNKNDDLEISIDYEQVDKDLFYSLIIIYKFEVVATKSYYYNKFAFRIWDLYNDFQQDENQFLLRISLYDPQFFMPQQTSFQINLNFEPSGGQIIMTPLIGTALDTEYTIEVKDLFDQDQPFSYKYFYYTDKQSYQKEITLGSNQLQNSKNLLQDFQNQNTITTILPRADFNADSSKYEALIMVSVSDSLGAIQNLTQIVEINPPSTDLNTQISNIQDKFDQLSILEQQKQVQLLNILSNDISKFTQTNCTESNCSGNGECNTKEFTCTCNEGFFASDCSISDEPLFIRFVQLKKSLYNKLQDLLNKQTSTAVQDQIQKSLNYLMQANDLASQYSTDEISNQIGNTQSILQQQKEVIENLVSQNLLNQGDNKISRKNIQAQETIGKSVDFLDKLFLNLNNEQEKQVQNNNKTRFLQENLNNIQQIYDITKNTSQLLNKVMLPNADPFTFKGKSIFQEISKNTKSKVIENFFGTQFKHNFQQFQDEIEPEISKGIPDTVGDILENTMTIFSKNPFQQDPQFPYKNQSTQLQDMEINEIGNLTSISIDQPYSLSFDRISEDDNEIKSCIQKEGNIWKGEFCDTVVTELESGGFKTKCECKSLNPTTVIADAQNIFKNSEVNKVFSEDGLTAFVDFNFWESYIFYIYIIKLLAFIYFVYRGLKLDKKDSILAEIKELELIEKEKELKDNFKDILKGVELPESIQSSQKGSLFKSQNITIKDIPQSSPKQVISDLDTPLNSENDNLNRKIIDLMNQNLNKDTSNVFIDIKDPTPQTKQEEKEEEQQLSDPQDIETPNLTSRRNRTRKKNKTFRDAFQINNKRENLNNQSEIHATEVQTQVIRFSLNENPSDSPINSQENIDTDRALNTENNFFKETRKSTFNKQNRKKITTKKTTFHPKKLFSFLNTEKKDIVNEEIQQQYSQNSQPNSSDDNEQLQTQINQVNLDKNSSLENQETLNPEQLSGSKNKNNNRNLNKPKQQSGIIRIEQEYHKESQKTDKNNESDNNNYKGDDIKRVKQQKFKELQSKLGCKTIEKEIEQSKYRGTAEALFRLHQLFGIFLVFEEELSRPKRFVLYYLRIHILLALTALFSQNMEQLESLTFSLLSALILGIPVLIIKALLKKKKKCAQIIGSFFYILLYLISVYSILVQAALMGVDKSNEWSISYFTTYCVDTFMFESFGNFFKISLLRHEIIKGQTYIIRKIFGNKDIIDFIQNK